MSLKVPEMRRSATIDVVSIGSAVAEPGQRRAIGAQQEDRLDEIAARLLDGERGQRAVVAGAFGHHAVDRQAELLVDLRERELGHGAVAAALVGQQVERMGDRRLAALDRDVHDQPSTAMLRGSAKSCDPAVKTTSTPQGKSAWLSVHACQKSAPSPPTATALSPAIPGPRQRRAVPAPSTGTSITRVAERSG